MVTLLKINVPPSQINDPPSQINVPRCQINVPLSNEFPNFLGQNHMTHICKRATYLCPFLTMCTGPNEVQIKRVYGF